MSERTRQEPSRRNYDSGNREYTIRQYRDRDRTELLSLYQDVLDPALTEAWFEWKYENTPYIDDIPVYVAEFDGQLVGAGGFWVLELHTGYRSTRVVQPCDAAVRRAHRRQGLFTEILGLGLERFDQDGLDIAFDFPNELSKATFEKYGWRPVERQETYFRVQQPGAMIGRSLSGPVSSVLDSSLQLLARGYLAGKSYGRSSVSVGEIDVVQTDEIPASTLATLYRRDVPEKFHIVRDETFYEWRFGNPQWEYTAYVGRYDGSPVAAIITGTTVENEMPITRLTDVVPLVPTRARTAVGVQILEAVLEANRDVALVISSSGAIPSDVLTAYGFQSNHSLPLSLVSTPTVHGVCTLRAEDGPESDRWIVDGKQLTDPDSWQITFTAYDTS